jgi:hypothetical protein
MGQDIENGEVEGTCETSVTLPVDMARHPRRYEPSSLPLNLEDSTLSRVLGGDVSETPAE